MLNTSLCSTFGSGIPGNTDFIVAKDSSGDFTTVQQAVDAVPDNSSERTIIYIKSGVYEEPVNIGAAKKNVVLYGENPKDVIITYKTEPTLDLATMEVYATGLIACNLTLANSAGSSYGPAQALRQEVDKSIYINCRLLGNQDTYRNKRIRSYFRNCYIEGTTDFIFGDGTVVFEDCEIYSKGGSAITAASTKDYVEFGYVFRNCRVVSKENTTTHLGRPWKDYAAVAYINCELPDEIVSAGWHNWDKPEREQTSRFSEYRNYGPGADTTYRVDWAHMLSAAEAEQFSTLNVFRTTYTDPPVVDNWDPYAELDSAGITGLNAEGDGYGMNEGGNGGTVVTVSNEADLKKYATSASKYLIRVSGHIQLTNRLDIGSNTTITGINGESGISGAALNITNERENVIIRYLNITNPEGDGISVWNGNNVFITHISFYNCGDGCCDINRGSDSVTVSWCKFYYPGQDDHRFTMIADGFMTWNDQGVVDSYGDKLHLTLHHNWWYTRSDQRMPASTNTKAHIYNNYFNCTGNSYCSNARHLTEFYSENNYYDNVKNPCYQESGGRIHTSGNIYNNCKGSTSPGTDSVFKPGYVYMLTSAESVPRVVTSRAGNVWDDPEQYKLNATSNGYGMVSPRGTLTYNEGQLVTLTASPFINNRFSGWSGDMTGYRNPLVFFMDADYTITGNFESTLGVDNKNADVENSIYPNPTPDGSFYLRLGSMGEGEAAVRIYSLPGSLVFREKFESTPGQLYVRSGLGKGLYLVTVNTGGKIYNLKLMVN